MKPVSNLNLKISVISPVHIGSGEELIPFNYLVDDGILYEFSPEKVLEILPDSDRSAFLEIASARPNPNTINRIREFFIRRSQYTIASSHRATSVTSEFDQLYNDRIAQFAQPDSKTINQLIIEPSLRNEINLTPYIPGSSIKGAVRTALLDQLNKGQPLSNPTEKNGQLQQRLFGYQKIEDDPMALVHISDANWAGKSKNVIFKPISKILFAVNRSKKNSVEAHTDGGRQNLRQNLEVIDNSHLAVFHSRLSIFESPGRNVQYSWTPDKVAAACNNFYLKIFQMEIGELVEKGLVDNDWADKCLRTVLAKIQESNFSKLRFLLRVGRHSGAESVTLEGVRKIKIKSPKSNQDQDKDKATTWWLASTSSKTNNNTRPFGWVLVECFEGDIGNSDQNGSANSIFPDDVHEFKLQEELVANNILQATKELENLQKRKAEIRSEQIKQVAAEQQREEELAKLSVEERELKFFQQKIEVFREKGDKPKPGGELSNIGQEILTKADTWPQPIRYEAADTLEEFFNWIGWGKSQKKRQRKNGIENLRRVD